MSNASGKYLVPGSIIVAGLLIAGAFIFSSDSNGGTISTGQNELPRTQDAGEIRPITPEDHVLGNPNADITIIEYSDFECPFCGRFHPTLSRLVEERTDIKWVYRHFPLSTIHSRALGAAVASECVATLGGNDAFWQFSDELFNNQRQLGRSLYTQKAAELGIEQEAFQVCLEDPMVRDAVEADHREAVSNGGRGTPFSILITASGEALPFSGALPYEQLIALVEQVAQN